MSQYPSNFKNKWFCLILVFLIVPLTASAQAKSAVQNIKFERVLYQNILKTVKNELKEKYYDEKLRGIDLEANAKTASELINAASSAEEMTDIVARFLYPFDDSHLFFIPPRKTIKVDYGWKMRFIGDKAFVTEVDEKSDAHEKGLRVGDQIYMLEGYILNRQEFSMVRYHFNILRPRSSLNVIVIKPSGNKYKIDLKAKLTEDSVFLPSRRDLNLESENAIAERTRQFFSDEIPGLSIWKMPSFQLTPIKVDKMMDKAKKNGSLILDLRGNSGGYLISLVTLAANFFDEPVEVGQILERKGTKALVIDPREKKNYAGKLVVLIDSDTGSAAELFARIVQLENRGTIIGDRSAGAVMTSLVFYHAFGLDTRIPYGISVTIADVKMKDGGRLEKIGVTPDKLLLPTAQDMAAGRDPVLAYAAQSLGFQLTPEQAAAVFEEAK